MSAPRCPYCGRSASVGGKPTRDHVFVEAFGGHCTVLACASCNGTIGHRIEGALQKPGQLMNLVRLARGHGHPLAGELRSGRRVSYDPNTLEVRDLNPVTRRKTAEGDVFEIHGGPRQVRGILRRDFRLSEAAVEAHLASASPVDMTDAQIDTTVTHSLDLGARLAAKVALGAGALASGDDFVSTALADKLRDVMWGMARSSTYINNHWLEGFDDLVRSSLLKAGATKLVAPIKAHPDASQVVFHRHWSSDGQPQTAVFVHIAGVSPAMAGLLLDAPCPFGGGFPLVVIDERARAVIRHVEDEIGESLATSPALGPPWFGPH